ncbi:MAG: discoidin domain-containing protein [Tannerellaceae bacterium]|nr:discoidin domain-containing protein [Tannerellaceae bacterium]
MLLSILVFFPVLLLPACRSKGDALLLEQALALAGENRPELEKALSRYQQYPADSLKYKAACFLIENMPYYHYYEGESLGHYANYYKALHEHKKRRDIKPEVILDSIKGIYGEFNIGRLQVKYDLREIDSAYLCNNIEWAFKVWREQPWGKSVSFEDFCEYILPYRIGDEGLSDWREDFYNRFNPLLDALRDSGATDADDPVAAVRLLMTQLPGDEDVYFTTTAPSGIPHLGPAVSLYKSGSCREISDFVVYACRALGIPCHLDFMPVRGNGNAGHVWNSYRNKFNELYVQEFPDAVYPVQGSRMQKWLKSKVYRYTFSLNMPVAREMAPRAIDVTAPYAEYYARYLKIPASGLYRNRIKTKFVYLCSSRKMDWQVVDWAPYSKDSVTFENIQAGVVLRLATWKNRRMVFLSDPFSVDSFSNEISYFSGNGACQDVTLYAKYDESDCGKRMVGGVFEASNTPDFSKKEVLHAITELPYRLTTAVNVAHSGKKYRYVRYRGPEGGHCNVAEIAFYENPEDTLALQGKIIGTAGCWQGDGSHEYTNAFDGKTETSFDYKEPSGGWTGLDLGEPKSITHIVYTPRNFDNYIKPGDTYELFYCDTVFKSLGVTANASDSLFYQNVPAGRLLYLKNHSRSVQERIFTYEEGKQIWK